MKTRWLVVHSFLSHKSNQNKKRLNVGPKEPSQNIRHFSRVGRLDFYYIGFCPNIKKRANSLLAHQKVLAEREGFEPPVRFPVHLISSQAPSTGLGHLSAVIQLVSRLLRGSQFLCCNVRCNSSPDNARKLRKPAHPADSRISDELIGGYAMRQAS